MDNYKKAILAKYDAVKEGLHADLLGQPTPAKLKELSLLLLDSLNANDRTIYSRFFKLDNPDFNGIKKFDNDKFRPIINFIEGKTFPRNSISVELLAILVDFQPRPYQKFSRVEPLEVKGINGFAMLNEPPPIYENEGNDEDDDYDYTVSGITPYDYEVGVASAQSMYPDRQDIATPVIHQKFFANRNSNARANFIKLLAFVLLIAGGIYFVKTNYFEEKGCMIWKYDHYENVPCNLEVNTFAGKKVIPLDNELLMYQRKIKVTDTTTFFNPDNSPRVWYGKSANKEYEYFSHPGNHPETDRELKKITHYIIDNHIKNRK